MDQFLSEEGVARRKATEAFMEKINPTLYDFTERATFPHHLVPELGKLGIGGIDTPKEFGGLGKSTFEACACVYELARRDASIAGLYVSHLGLGLATVEKLAADPLRAKIMAECI